MLLEQCASSQETVRQKQTAFEKKEAMQVDERLQAAFQVHFLKYQLFCSIYYRHVLCK